MLVKRRSALFGEFQLLAFATFHSFVAIALMRAMFVFPKSAVRTQTGVGYWMFVLAAIFLAAPIPWLYRRVIRSQLIAYCIVVPLLLCFFTLAMELLEDVKKPDIFFIHRDPLMIVHINLYTLLILSFSTLALVSVICRLWFGPMIIQNGTMCPGCSYSLVGCDNQTCPECGREFTYQELGTTREELQKKCSTSGEQPAT